MPNSNVSIAERSIETNFPNPAMGGWNETLENKSAIARVEWAMDHLPGNFVLSSSFGIQSAVMLHLLTQVKSDIPVLITDTGHLFPETYRFIEQLTERLDLNLQVYQAKESAAWQVAKYGEEWAHSDDSLKAYNRRNKVEPLERGLTG